MQDQSKQEHLKLQLAYTQYKLKGTQAREFFWLRYWILYIFMFSYAFLLFSRKKFFIGPILGKLRSFRE